MASLFSKPESYKPPPTPDNSAEQLAAAAAAERERDRKMRGRASNILTSSSGLTDEPLTSSNVLLGS